MWSFIAAVPDSSPNLAWSGAVLREPQGRGRLLPVPEPAPPIARVIEAVRREAADAVVLRLDCGHPRHVRHRPPLSSHPWVLDDEACAQRVGHRIECLRCGQRQLPEHAEPYRRTAEFDEHTVPAGLRRAHTTKRGVWGRLVVERGELPLCFDPPLAIEVVARPGEPVIIPPELPHSVRPRGPVRFAVEFLRVRSDDG
ncbi:DUF3565 domain-containing protein [Paraliomyxa miuraensis]|uniref:DUF3565 domain-containing protein n=1 Tax=Paraliomyxa miuraensis TaxID=376150 RepID=UPI00224CDC0C|nr:DUF3565 domain-containing protein [Paraliomyxa miuraensis]MCX4242910.1 DUF3565 domain-containing protein [Paraliomyxa miuraensis]